MRNDRIYAAAACAVLVLGMAGCGATASAQTPGQTPAAGTETTAAPSEESTVVEEVGGTIESMEAGTQETAPQSLCVSGPVTAAGDNTLTIDNQSGVSSAGEMVLTVDPESTWILDASAGIPMALGDISVGDTVYAYIGEAMTMSLPPITNAKMVIANVPADAKAPVYVTIGSVVTDGSSGQVTLTTEDGTSYQLTEDCVISPFRTRNIVTLDDLSKGKSCVLWADDGKTVSRIVLLG